MRVAELTENLARQGFETHLLFVGDPAAPGRESRIEGRLTLYRWCQWISAYHPTGVYEAEEDKLRDLNDSAPPFIVEQIIRPAVSRGRLAVVLAEEWQMAEALIRLHDQLENAGLRQRCVLFWNANNTTSFSRVDWARLRSVAQLTTVSRYMKHLMWGMGLNPLVIPNGIPASLLAPVDTRQVAVLRAALRVDEQTIMLFKVGRFDPAKRWIMAVEAASQLKSEGYRVVFPMRGGIEPHGYEVLARARELGLSIVDINVQPDSWPELVRLLQAAPPAEIYNLRFFMSQELLRPFYSGADAVLANSGHEPFGLVGLEAMAAGGLVFTGMTGEEYTLGGQSAISLDTDWPDEIVAHVLELRNHPARAEAMRKAARAHAALFTWDEVSQNLLDKIEFIAQESGALPRPNGHVVWDAGSLSHG